ncbi:MAG: RluA family pseudouridine synthase [Terriglobales bacterium]
MPDKFPIFITVRPEAAGKRLDQFLAAEVQETSRARVQQLISDGKVLVNDSAARASLRLRGNERISILGPVELPPLRAIPEEISLDIVFEDDDLAVINKPAGMMVHAGAGATEADRNRGTLVNALLHRFSKLSGVGGELRPGIVHRLDKATSGLIVVAKNDEVHRRLSAQFARREVKKTYIALAHGWMKQNRGTINTAISRDRVHRTKMTTRRDSGREAITHYSVRRRIDSPLGKFTLVEVKIDTGRTHQIRVHLSSLGHPIVGDALYGAPRNLRGKNQSVASPSRNFLHAAALQFQHPRTGGELSFSSALPLELQGFLARVSGDDSETQHGDTKDNARSGRSIVRRKKSSATGDDPSA